ncbi:FZO-like protein isoform X2 [Tasmannia lanceolata]|uniref:FZO-like protein isoform X2 n=1 Tax=Tasmannia lanceolata TaxID=3420 RepID=UPI00406388BA
MVSLPCNSTFTHLPKFPLLFKTNPPNHFKILPKPTWKFQTHSVKGLVTNSGDSAQPRPPRTLFPGGFKRPEIQVPTLVLQVSSDEVLKRENVLNVIDKGVSKWVGIVMLDCGEASGGRLYEAARVLKSVIKDRAYLVIGERVDIAAAVGASGVVLSDQGLPAIVARNMMMESKSDSKFLPLVARTVQTPHSALSASGSEGADFLVLGIDGEKCAEVLVKSVCQQVKVPVFAMIDLLGELTDFTAASNLLHSGASGLVIRLKSMKMFSDDILSKLFYTVFVMNKRAQGEFQTSKERGIMDLDKEFYVRNGVTRLTKLEDKEKKLIEAQRVFLLDAIAVIRKAAPLMDEVSLLVDAVSRLDDPFLLVIVGEFNSGKSTVINTLLGKRYLKEGVVPTTNEITLLCYSEMGVNEQQRCERHPDGQFICYLPAPILKEMNIVDTPGTNVILQRQQRLTEEFVPRADLLIFVISADRPLTESEVAFLRYIQQWKKKLEEATAFIKDNTRKLLNTEHVTLYPVSARSALEAKLSALSDGAPNYEELLLNDPRWKTSSFYELENFLFSFLDSSTDMGIERMKLKLGTPIGIANRLITACETLVKQECDSANQDLILVGEIVSSVKEFATKIESDSISWKKQSQSLIDIAKARAVKLTESTLKLSNLELVVSSFLQGDKSGSVTAGSSVQNDIITPALSDAQRLLSEYLTWLRSSYARQGKRYRESFAKRWPVHVNREGPMPPESHELLVKREDFCLQVIDNFSASAAGQVFDQEIREVVMGSFGGLGAAGLSASLLTSVLPTTVEDLLALGICSAGGFLAISNFPSRRKEVIDKVKRVADALARELEEAMQKDLMQTVENLDRLVELMSRPYQEAAQNRLNRLLEIQEELSKVERQVRILQTDIQNLHIFSN